MFMLSSLRSWRVCLGKKSIRPARKFVSITVREPTQLVVFHSFILREYFFITNYGKQVFVMLPLLSYIIFITGTLYHSHILPWMTYLRGYCTPNQKLAWFVLYFKMINTFMKNQIHLIVNCPRSSKKAFFSRQIGFYVMDQNS